MSRKAYQLRGADGCVLVSAEDLDALVLAVGDLVDERALRSRADRLPNRSLAQAIHAMLDQEEPPATIRAELWPAME